jgi:long-chain acyl-CoA synthetase
MDTLRDLLDRIAGWGRADAVVAFTGADREVWSFADLAGAARRLAGGLVAAGVGRQETVGLLAPAGPLWAMAWLGIVAAGATVVPLDESQPPDDLLVLLRRAECRRLFTTRAHAERLAAAGGREIEAILLEGDQVPEGPYRHWRQLLAAEERALPAIAAADVAVVVFTSGTTGTPKAVPLSHRNLLANLTALLEQRIAGPGDRALLPLPLHHVYPLMIGLLVPMGAGVTVVFPAGVSGPELAAALRLGGITHLVGVPRLYQALYDAIQARLAKAGAATRRLVPLMLRLSIRLRRRFGLGIGGILFRPLRRALAPRLHTLISGGAALDEELEWSLDGLGFEVLTGYGLSETSPVLTFNRRGRARPGSAGQPIAGVDLRIQDADARGTGEVQARGASIFSGYRGDPATTAAAFTADGWFRTGDLGYLDAEDALHIVARESETIVLADGKKIFPEDLEARYAGVPLVRELAVLGRDGGLVGLAVPDLDAARAIGGQSLEERIRFALADRAAQMPSWQRLGGIAVTTRALPRTHLGKLRRHLLPALYEQAKARRGAVEAPRPSPEDERLLAQPAAARLWAWLQRRFPDHVLTLDASPQIELGIDSLGWVSLTLEIEHELGLSLGESELAEVVTFRHLLQAAVAAEGRPPPSIAAEEERWLSPPGPLRRLAYRGLAAIDRLAMRLFFRLDVSGIEHLPAQGPCLICPNHASYLDPLMVAAALPDAMLARTYWAGWTGILFSGPLGRAFSRACQVVPIDPERAPGLSLALARAVLRRGGFLVWFPEGARSPDGSIRRFQPGVGRLVSESGVPVVPIRISGTFAAWPRQRRWPRLSAVRVTIGAPVPTAGLRGEGAEAIAARLREAVAALAEV